MNYTIRISGLASAIAALDPTILHKPARNLMNRVGIKVQANARNNSPIDRGGLRDSVAYEVDPAAFPKSVRVGSGLEYARATELGRPAGIMPPVGPLEDWAQRKGLGARAGWPIALKIRDRGTAPKPFLLPAVTDAEPAIKKYATVFAKEIEQEAASRGGGV